MSEPDPRIARFYDKDAIWRAELSALRAILNATPLVEEFKWRSPTYTAAGGNIATVWRLKDRCAVGFFKGALLDDPEGLLQPPGDNSRSMRVMNFTSVPGVEAAAPALTAFVTAAIAAEEAGLKVEMPSDDLAYPEELTARLDSDPAFRAAFEALTPGRQRSWVLHISQAKQPATRVSRIDKAEAKIFAGKGLSDR